MYRDDSLWKAILEDIFDDFLLYFFKENAALFDFDKGFTFLDKELEQLFPAQDSAAPKFVDKLVKVFTKDGTEGWLLVHIEVQDYNDGNFAERMYTYFYRIKDTYGKPVTSIAIFTDGNKSFRPNVYEYGFLGTSVRYQYNTFKVIDQDEAELAKDDNPFAMVILIVLLALRKGKITEDELYNLKVELARKLLQKNIAKNKIRALMNFLRYYVRFASKKTITKFEEAINVITNKQTTMGIEEFLLTRAETTGRQQGIQIGRLAGKQEGRLEGRQEEAIEKNTFFVKQLLLGSDFSLEKIADMAGVTVAFVESIKQSL